MLHKSMLALACFTLIFYGFNSQANSNAGHSPESASKAEVRQERPAEANKQNTGDASLPPFQRIEKLTAQSDALPASAAVFHVNKAALNAQHNAGSSALTLENFPLGNQGSGTLDLRAFDVLSSAGIVVAGSRDGDRPIDFSAGRFYRGSVRGVAGSYVYLSITGEETLGYVDIPADGAGQDLRYVIAPIDKRRSGSDLMMVCNIDDLPQAGTVPQFCDMLPSPDDGRRFDSEDLERRKAGGDRTQSGTLLVAQIAIECDYAYFLDHQQNLSRAANYALSLMGAVSAIFQLDVQCALQVPFLRVWTSPDPYPGTTSHAKLSAFEDYWDSNMTHVKRSLAHLFSGVGGMGGRASGFNGLCDSGSGNEGYAVSGLHNTVVFPRTVPYTWDIHVVAHETGHNFGARHTHDCYWIIPIDSCSKSGTFGNCVETTVATTGTIMSYCGSRRHYFHPRVATGIRRKAESSSCLEPLVNEHAKDVAAEYISVPAVGAHIVTGASIIPAVLFKNRGSADQSSLDVSFSIQTSSGTLVYSNVQTIATLPSRTQLNVTFAALSLVTVGSYVATAEISLSGDDEKHNNERSQPLEVVSSASGTLVLTAPNSSATYTAGSTLTISWTATGLTDVHIDYSTDEGASWSDVISKVTASDGSYDWTVAPSPTTTARIRIRDRLNAALGDESDSDFTIDVPNDIRVVELINPLIDPIINPSFKAPLTPSVSVHNVGSEQQTEVSVHLRLVHEYTEIEDYRQTLVVPELEPGETRVLHFPKALLFAKRKYNIYATVKHEGDLNPMNDSLTRSFDISSKSYPRVAGGRYHSLAILPWNGTVFAWGYNFYGQLGNGSTERRSYPIRVADLRDVVDVAGGGWHSYALKADGSLWSWGRGNYGQLGNGLSDDKSKAVQMSNLDDIVDVESGFYHGVALKNNGSVWTMGRNNYGQLGDGSTTNRSTAVQVSGLTSVVAVAGGQYHSCALKHDGTVWAWGRNNYGQLGDGTNSNSSTPVAVSGITTATAIAAGSNHSLALLADGTIRAWGYNSNGQLGNGLTSHSSTAVVASGLSDATMIAAGSYHSYALDGNVDIWAWGRNSNGQLGDGTSSDRLTPVEVLTSPNIIEIARSGFHSIHVNAFNEICAVGRNQYGQLGDQTLVQRTDYVCRELEPTAGHDVTAAGYDHTVALKVNEGTVWAWGRNNSGQLGDGTTTNSSTPVQVSGLDDVAIVSAGAWHNLAAKTDGTLWAWGDGASGKLGIGSTIDQTTPVQVTTLSTVVAAVAGVNHSMALKRDGRVWTWGSNTYGQLGNGTTANSSTPVQVSGLSDAIAIAAGLNHSVALKVGGTVWTWGSGGSGQLGDGSDTDQDEPIQVSGLNAIVAIAAGLHHCLALDRDGTVWAWGINLLGEIGDGSTTKRSTPVKVSNLSNVVKVRCGSNHSYALKSDGTVWAWGYNFEGQLGSGSFTINQTTPVQASGVSNAVDIGKAAQHSLVYKADGTLCASGMNTYGELGDGTTTNQHTFTCLTQSFLKDRLDDDNPALPLNLQAFEEAGILRVYPNPNKGSFSVECHVADPMSFSLSLVDIMGRELQRFSYRDELGLIRADVELGQVPPGIYFLRMHRGGLILDTQSVIVE